jgi:signal transduction histidine kinase/ligand-binding sensor domain-containing protein
MIMKGKIFICIAGVFFFMLLSSVFSFSRDKTIHFNTENGSLTHNSVEAIVRDSLGYVWIGTNFGLNRLDGYHTVSFLNHETDSTSLSDNVISSLFVDSQGYLWIGTVNGGLNTYDYKTSRFTRYQASGSSQSILGNNISSITEDQNGNIWLGIVGEGVSCFIPGRDEFKNYPIEDFSDEPIPNTNINDLWCDLNNDIWVSVDFDRNALYKIDTETNEISFHGAKGTDDIGAITGIAERDDGMLFFTVWNNKLGTIDPQDDSHIKIVSEQEVFRSNHPTSLVFDSYGFLWVGTWENGIYKFDANMNLVDVYTNANDSELQLSSNSINRLYFEDGILWVGHRNGGVDMLTIAKPVFQTIDLGSSYGFSQVDVNAFCADDQYIWVGSRGQGLFRYDKQKNNVKRFSGSTNPGMINDDILCIEKGNDGLLWLGTDGDFVGELNPATGEISFIPHQEGDWSSVFCIAETDSFLWCGTWGAGVKKLDKKSRIYKTIHFDQDDQYNNSVFDVVVDGNTLWLASFGLGLIQYDLTTGSSVFVFELSRYNNAYSDVVINDLFLDDNKNLWLSTSGSGLFRYSTLTGDIKVFTKQDGLSGNVVQASLVDDNRNLWVSTNRGVSFLNLDNAHNVYTFYRHNGLLMNNLNKSALFYHVNTRQLFVGSPAGMNYCYTDSISIDQTTEPVVVTKIEIDGEQYGQDRYGQKNVPSVYNDQIVLKHYHKVLAFHFSAMNFNPSFKNSYYYKLEGFDSEWYSLSFENNSVQYTNLDPGEYVFNVKASNSDGIIGDKVTTVPVVVKPAWWETLLFKILFVVVALSLIILYVRVQLKKSEQEQIKLEKLVQQRTKEINEQKEHIEKQKAELEIVNQTKDKFISIIGHDLRNPISTIDQFNELLILDADSLSEEEKDKFHRVLKKTSAYTIDLLDDLLVWAKAQTKTIKIEKEKLSVNELFRETEKIVDLVAMKKDITVQFKSLSNVYVYADYKSILTVLRNLVTNAIKFSESSSQVKIDANVDDEFVTLSVADNGRGMNKHQLEKLFKVDYSSSTEGTMGETGSGLGLIISKEFVNLNGGEIWAYSEPGNGSTFYFTLKRSL